MTRKQIDTIDKKIEALEKQREKAIDSLHKKCKHKDIVESRYKRGICIDTAEFRVCRTCGYAEEGWGCGYWKLNTTDDVPTMSHDSAYKYVLKYYSQDDLSEKRFGRRPQHVEED